MTPARAGDKLTYVTAAFKRLASLVACVGGVADSARFTPAARLAGPAL
ncbi:hypothetical protein BN406_04126 (plasmid) [Sinorhizobium meliloti Rm41]|nr:hypothetical protein BN406_04126 [Sinorhizobium meliloti Rm41]